MDRLNSKNGKKEMLIFISGPKLHSNYYGTVPSHDCYRCDLFSMFLVFEADFILLVFMF